jgi:hypothetical protein
VKADGKQNHNHRCENLMPYVVFLYEEATHRYVPRFEKDFLLTCFHANFLLGLIFDPED